MKTKLNIDKKSARNYAIALIAGLVLGWLFFHHSGNSKELVTDHTEHTDKVSIWTCSMHPQIRMDKPGKCPICSMDLIPLETGSSNDEGLDPNEIQMSESAIKLAEIQTLLVRKDYSNKEVYLLGKVKPDERNIAELTARFGGRIEKLYVNFTGQNVSKGGKLATIYSPELVTAQKELLEAIEYKDSNPAFYKAIRNKLKLWDLTEAQIDGIETRGEPQNYFDVLSPISGTVTMRHVSLGDYVKEGNALFQVIDLRKVWVMFEAYQSDLPWLQQGNKVEFTVQSLPGESFTGRVTNIDPFLDPRTRIANVRVEVDNPRLDLKPEMFANGIIKPRVSGTQKELLIPRTSVLWTGKRAVVYVRVPGREQTTFVYREITLGPETGEFYIVKAGLAEGEEIAVNGVFKIDAAAQLEGKPSMMNPDGGKVSSGHKHTTGSEGHGEMDMESPEKTSTPVHKGMEMPAADKAGSQSTSEKAHGDLPMEANLDHVMFKVSGNCEMCKATIEKAAQSLDGVNSANWNIETKEIHLSYNHDKVDLASIHKAIAASGYDTEKETASREAYEKLPPCCQYTR